MEKQIIDIAYELAKVKYNKKPFTFADLWKEVVRQARLDKSEQAQAGYVYTQILQDNRFIFIGESKFLISEFLTEEEQKQYANALYDFKQEDEEEQERIKKIEKEDDYLYKDNETDEEYGQTRPTDLEEDEEQDEDNEEQDEDVAEQDEDDEEVPTEDIN